MCLCACLCVRVSVYVCVCVTNLLHPIVKLTISRVKISLKENDHFNPVKIIPLKVQEMQRRIDFK